MINSFKRQDNLQKENEILKQQNYRLKKMES